MESKVIEYIKQKRNKDKQVMGKIIRRKARSLFSKDYPGFTASTGWQARMVERKKAKSAS